MTRRRQIPPINVVGGFTIGSVVAIEKKDTFRGIKLAVVTDRCKWDDEGIVCTLTDSDFPFREVIIFPQHGDKITLVSSAKVY